MAKRLIDPMLLPQAKTYAEPNWKRRLEAVRKGWEAGGGRAGAMAHAILTFVLSPGPPVHMGGREKVTSPVMNGTTLADSQLPAGEWFRLAAGRVNQSTGVQVFWFVFIADQGKIDARSRLRHDWIVQFPDGYRQAYAPGSVFGIMRHGIPAKAFPE